MIPSQLVPLANHLWQSTLFAALAGLLTLLLRANRAQVRYWLWLSASVKLLVPFSILVVVGGLIGRHTTAAPTPLALVPAAEFSFVVQQVGEPFTIAVPRLAAATIQRSSTNAIVTAFIFVWAVGFLVLVFRWILRWRRLDAEIFKAPSLNLSIELPVKSSPAFGEPGLFGIFQPVLLLPDGIMDHLTAEEMEAIVAHELCHARHRDNLATAIHMAVEAVFWFHPLVWWLGARLIEERERACDEEVLQGGREPRSYAEGILKICDLYLASRLACVAGVTGGDLKRRIEAIMSHRVGVRLNFAKRVVLTVVTTAAIAAPVIFGIIYAPEMRAQSPENAAPSAAASAKFNAVSIKPFSTRPLDPFYREFDIEMYGARHAHGGRFEAEITLNQLIQLAYNVKDFQVVEGPSWANTDRYEFIAKADDNATFEQMQPMLRSLLGDRFKLTFHRETKELPIYELAVAAGGLKIMAAKEGSCVMMDPNNPPLPFDPNDPSSIYCKDDLQILQGRMGIRADRIAMPRLIDIVSDDVHRIVIDKTGYAETFNLRLEFAPNVPVPSEGRRLASGPSISTALQEQLGLQLQSVKGPVEMLVIDHLERPSEN